MQTATIHAPRALFTDAVNNALIADLNARIVAGTITRDAAIAEALDALKSDLRAGFASGRFAPSPTVLDANGEPIDLSGRKGEPEGDIFGDDNEGAWWQPEDAGHEEALFGDC